MEIIELLKQYKIQTKKTEREIAAQLNTSESQLNRWLHGRCTVGRLWSAEIRRKIKIVKNNA